MDNKLFGTVAGILGIFCLTFGIYSSFGEVKTVSPTDKSIIESITNFGNPIKPEKDERVVTVPANVEWYDPKIYIPAGKPYRIRFVSGTWTNQIGTQETQALGKHGDDRNKLIVPGAYSCQLVARIGKAKFATGNEYTGTSTTGEWLFLSINDRPNTFADNKGSLKVFVKIME